MLYPAVCNELWTNKFDRKLNLTNFSLKFNFFWTKRNYLTQIPQLRALTGITIIIIIIISIINSSSSIGGGGGGSSSSSSSSISSSSTRVLVHFTINKYWNQNIFSPKKLFRSAFCKISYSNEIIILSNFSNVLFPTYTICFDINNLYIFSSQWMYGILMILKARRLPL